MSDDEIHAEVTAYKGLLIIELKTFEPIEGETLPLVNGPFYMGQQILNTSKHLGVSKEAVELMKQMRAGATVTGIISWERIKGLGDCFTWRGGPFAIVDPLMNEVPQDFKVRKFVTIPNEVPEGAMANIDEFTPVLH